MFNVYLRKIIDYDDDDGWLNNWFRNDLKLKDPVSFPEILFLWCQPPGILQIKNF